MKIILGAFKIIFPAFVFKQLNNLTILYCIKGNINYHRSVKCVAKGPYCILMQNVCCLSTYFTVVGPEAYLRPFEISKMDLLSEIDILEEDGCRLKEKLFGQFALLMNSTYEVIYKLLEWLLHSELTLITLSLDSMS